MNRRQFLQRVSRGYVQNVSFSDIQEFVEAFGYRLARVSGSHLIFVHASVPVWLNLQDLRGEVKPYRTRQFLRIVGRYGIRVDADE